MRIPTRSLSLILVVSVFIAARAGAQDLTGYEKLLLPAFSARLITGANGSTFATGLTTYTEVETSYYAGREATSNAPVFRIHRPFSTYETPLDYGPPAATGRFLYVDAAKISEFSAQYLMTSAAAADATPHVTALPVVRTPLTRTSRVFGIPDEPIIEHPNDQIDGIVRGYVYRNTLRVYNFDLNGAAQVTVERFVQSVGGRTGSLGKVVLNLDRRGGDDPTFPYFGQIDLPDYCLLFGRHTPCLPLKMWIEIVPITPGLRYWGFVSSTNNSTAEVTVFAPQPPPTNQQNE